MKMRLDLPPFRCPDSLTPHLRSVFDGEYEIPLWGSGKTILDVGANVGAFSVWASFRWPGSTIHAFEPNPACWELLEENTKGLLVRAERFGLGSPGLRPLFTGANNLGEASLWQNGGTLDTGSHVEIKDPKCVPKADILKLDCEGAELEVLSSLLTKHLRTFEAVMLEAHSEDLRRACDALLSDYRLVSSRTHPSGIGTYNYMRRDLCVF